MHCRLMQQSDLEAVVEIHRCAFPGFFLTRMGSGFLRGYYQTVLDFDASIALVACEQSNNKTQGFAVGFQDPQGFYALFSHRRRKLLPLVALALLRDPRLLFEILRNIRRVDAQSRQTNGSVELSSIGAITDGTGIGGALLAAFVECAHRAEATEIFLTTDADDNVDVRRFYERRDFVLDGYEFRGKRRLARYIRSLG